MDHWLSTDCNGCTASRNHGRQTLAALPRWGRCSAVGPSGQPWRCPIATLLVSLAFASTRKLLKTRETKHLRALVSHVYLGCPAISPVYSGESANWQWQPTKWAHSQRPRSTGSTAFLRALPLCTLAVGHGSSVESC